MPKTRRTPAKSAPTPGRHSRKGAPQYDVATQPAPSSSGGDPVTLGATSTEARIDRLESLLEGQGRMMLKLLENAQARAENKSPSATVTAPATTSAPAMQTSTALPACPIAVSAVEDISCEVLEKEAVAMFNSKQGSELAPFLLLGATLPGAVKSKIWSGQFVDLATLANPSEKPASVPLTISRGANPTISIMNPKMAQPRTIADWSKLFRVYAAVYLESFPQEGPAIMTYMSIIWELATSEPGYLWREYDLRFRSLRGICPSGLPWGRYNDEVFTQVKRQKSSLLAVTAASQSPHSSRAMNSARNRAFDYPIGCCRSFYLRGVCTRDQCRYEHRKGPGNTAVPTASAGPLNATPNTGKRK